MLPSMTYWCTDCIVCVGCSDSRLHHSDGEAVPERRGDSKWRASSTASHADSNGANILSSTSLVPMLLLWSLGTLQWSLVTVISLGQLHTIDRLSYASLDVYNLNDRVPVSIQISESFGLMKDAFLWWDSPERIVHSGFKGYVLLLCFIVCSLHWGESRN